MSKGGEVEMKSCFQSSDKQGESGGNRGKGGTGLQKRGRHIRYTSSSSTTSHLPQTYLIKTFPPQSPQYFQLLINPHPSAETGMSLGWELKSTHNCPISHRGGNCNCTHVDRGGRCRQRALAIYTRPGFFLFNLFSSPLPLLAPIFLSTALRSCSTTCELENRKIKF